MIFVRDLSMNVSYAFKFDDEKFYHRFNPNHSEESSSNRARNNQEKESEDEKDDDNENENDNNVNNELGEVLPI